MPAKMAAQATRTASLDSGEAARQEASRQDRVLSHRLRVLVVMMILTAVPLAVALAILPHRIQTILKQQSEQYLTQIAHDLALLTQRTMELQLQGVQSLGSLPEVRHALRQRADGDLHEADLAPLNSYLYLLVREMSTELQGIYLCDAHGRVFAGVLQNGGTEAYRNLDISDRDYFQHTARTLKPGISDPIVSKISGLPVVAVVTPILDEKGRFLGMLGMTIKIEHLSLLISGEKIGRTGYPFAIDRHGVMVSHPDPKRYLSTNLLNLPDSQRMMRRMMAGERGIEPYVSSLGIRKLAAFAPAPICGWSIGASIEIEEFEKPAQEIRGLLMMLLAACLLTGLVIACTLLVGLKRLNRVLADARASDRKVAEQAALLDEIRDSIIVQDLEGRIQFWNTGAGCTFGWESAEAIGHRQEELLAMEGPELTEAKGTVAREGLWRGRLQAKTKEGQLLTIDSRWTLVRSEQGSPRAIVSVGTDITEQLALEEKLLRAQRLESLGTLAGGIAHDLNNLLAPILMGTTMVRAEPLTASQSETVDIMEQSARRGAGLVRQVLTFAKGVKGIQVSVHLSYLVREIGTIIRSTFPKTINLVTQVPEDVLLIKADPTQLSQVLLNLCVNSRDAMPDGGTISLRVSNQQVDEGICSLYPDLKPGPHICIEQSDTGQGIPKEVLPRIFEPFFTTKSPGKGTGLGLSTVLGIIRGMQGTINVYSEPGKGTTFRIYIPASTEGTASKETAPETPPQERGNAELILLVDDEPAIRDIAAKALEANGYQVLTAENGVQALELYRKHHADLTLVVTDMMMPTMDGETLTHEIQKGENPRPILGMSGLSDPAQRRTQAAANLTVLSKPFTSTALLLAVAEVIRKQRA